MIYKLYVLIFTFLLVNVSAAQSSSEHVIITEDIGKRYVSIPGLADSGEQLDLFQKPVALLSSFPSKGPKWKNYAEDYIYDSIDPFYLFTENWELTNSLDAILANDCPGSKDLQNGADLADEYIDDHELSWSAVKIQEKNIEKTKNGKTVLYIVNFNSYLIYEIEKNDGKRVRQSCLVNTGKLVFKNSSVKSIADVKSIFLGIFK